MIKIGKHFFDKKDTADQGFFVYDIFEMTEKTDEQSEEKTISESKENLHQTVFERVLERRQDNSNNVKKRNILIFGISVVLLLIVILLASYLNVYRKNLPAEFCEKIASAYEVKNPDLFLKYCTNLPDELKIEENLKKYFNVFFTYDDCEFYQVASKYNNSQRYIFESNDKKIGEIFFVKNKKPAAFGIDSYSISSFEIYPLAEYKITAYSTYTVKINGKEIGKKYLQGRNTAFGYFNSTSHEMITRDIYVIDDLCYISKIEVVDTNGEVYDIPLKPAQLNIDIVINVDDKKEELTGFFKDFVYNYMYYTVVDNKTPDVILDYVYDGTNIYNAINKYYNDDTVLYDNPRIENLLVDKVLYYGSGYYTCTVSADFFAEVNEETVTKKFQKEVSLLYSDGRYYVINLADVFPNQ